VKCFALITWTTVELWVSNCGVKMITEHRFK